VSCRFVNEDGQTCVADAAEGGLCFWHDPEADKGGEDVRRRLEEWSDTGASMAGFRLRGAALEGLRLSNRPGSDLRAADLSRARLQGASLFGIDLSGADLSKANLSGANLNNADLHDANLLGATLDGARLERVEWGERCINEQRARQAAHEGDTEAASAAYEEAEEVYRALRRAYDGAGRFEAAGRFFRREMTMRRKLMPAWSAGRAWSKLVDLFCAYGESPPRVIVSAMVLNFAMAAIFFLLGVNGPEGPIRFDVHAGLWHNIERYFDCVYYAVVTFTTLGYGEITPTSHVTRHLAATHAFTGAFMMAMFVTVFGKKMTRG
jgi:hypothetical protein